MVLFLHNRYRFAGGEEKVLEDLIELVGEELDRPVARIGLQSSSFSKRMAARGLLLGGLQTGAIASEISRIRPELVHAHNLNPGFGWRALAAAQETGARTVLHLHNYRLVCAVATCLAPDGDCTRCQGRNTLPGIRLNCRGGSRIESLTYGIALATWQRRTLSHVDRFITPSEFAVKRLKQLGLDLRDRISVVPNVCRHFADRSTAGAGRYALVAGRLSPEKGVEDAISACKATKTPLVIAGDGPDRARLEALAEGGNVRFLGRLNQKQLAEVRKEASVAIVPSRCQENFPLSAVEAMAAGLPVIASAVGGVPELVPSEWLYPLGDAQALADQLVSVGRDVDAGERALHRARTTVHPEVVAPQLAAAYRLATCQSVTQ